MLIKYFNEEEVLEQITARLFTCNNVFYDCPSSVILTRNYLYIQEDNFDGTFTSHFKIPITKIISIEKFISKNDIEKRTGSNTPGILTSAIMALAGVIVLPKDSKKTGNNAFLNIKYRDEKDNASSIFFKDCSSICIKKMVNAFEKYKSFYG